MFKFLKDKIKDTLSKITKKVEEQPVEEIKEQFEEPKIEEKKPEKKLKQKKEKPKQKFVKEEPKEEIIVTSKEEPEVIQIKKTDIKLEKETEGIKEEIKIPEKKGFFSKIKEKVIKPKEEFKAVESIEIKEHLEKEIIEEQKIEDKKGFFDTVKEKITTTKISDDKFDSLFEELEIGLLENNVAYEVVDKIKSDLKENLVDKPIKRGDIEKEIKKELKESIEDLFLTPKIDLFKKIKEKKDKPFVICFLGQNGSGKTTSIAKLAHLLKQNNISVVLSASDTFRAAAIQQLKEWGNKLNIKVIAHDYGSDPAAVSFDAIEHAKAHKIDVVLIDTAGRQHSNQNLMRELEKIIKVAKPDLKIFIGESLIGSDAVLQAGDYNSLVGIDGIILTKSDVDEKGGAIISMSYVTNRPIIYLGVGQELKDLKEFNKDEIIKNLGL